MACSTDLKDLGRLLKKLCIPANDSIAVPVSGKREREEGERGKERGGRERREGRGGRERREGEEGERGGKGEEGRERKRKGNEENLYMHN